MNIVHQPHTLECLWSHPKIWSQRNLGSSPCGGRDLEEEKVEAVGVLLNRLHQLPRERERERESERARERERERERER